MQVALVVAGTGIPPSLAALIALRIAEPICLRIEERVQGLLHRPTDHPVQVIFDPFVIDLNNVAQRTRCILSHGGPFSLSWLRLVTSSSARFGAASQSQMCERYCTSSV